MIRSMALGGLLLCLLAARAEVPQQIHYQGRLSSGTNLVNGAVGLSLRLYATPAGGALLFEDSNTVTVVDGLYATFIGDQTTSGNLADALTNAQVWIEVAVNGVALTPREPMASVAYALATRGLLVATNNSVTVNAALNAIDPTSPLSTIGGGSLNDIGGAAANVVIGGGYDNNVAGESPSVVIAGGVYHDIGPTSFYATISGGFDNNVGDSSPYATIAGGRWNGIGRLAAFAAIAGGLNNSIQEGAYESFVGGGYLNTVENGAVDAVLAGGNNNSIGSGSSGAFLGGGFGNMIWPGSGGTVLGGGSGNSIGASATYSVIPGGRSNAVATGANHAFAAGYRAKANHNGTLVWADTSVEEDFESSANNQFLIRAAGGVGIGTNATPEMLTVAGNVLAAGFIGNGAGLTNIPAAAVTEADPIWNGVSNAIQAQLNQKAASNLVWTTFATTNALAGELAARIGADMALSNSMAALQTNVGARLATDVWAVAGSTTNYVRRTGDTMTGSLTNQQSITANAFFNAENMALAAYSIALGGMGNSIDEMAAFSTIGGGSDNSIGPDSYAATVAGGYLNVISTSAYNSAIGGGYHNGIGSDAQEALVAGGFLNVIQSNASYSAICGGRQNIIGNNAECAFAAGRRAEAYDSGTFVWADNQEASFASTSSNQFLIRARGGVGIGTATPGAALHVDGSVRLSERLRLSGQEFFEASHTDANGPTLLLGVNRPGNRQLWLGDSAALAVNSTNAVLRLFVLGTTPQIDAIATDGATPKDLNLGVGVTIKSNGTVTIGGNIGLGTSPTTNRIQTAGGAYCAGNGTAWVNASDRNKKDDFRPVDAATILAKVAAIPVATWRYKSEDAALRHIGPTAQDFYAAFGVGYDDTSIATVDADGVALAAIQALKRQLDEQKAAADATIQAMQRRNADLQARVEQLERALRPER